MLESIYERVTGQPYRTGRSMVAEFGPTPAGRFPELARYSDAELYEHGPQLVAELEQAAASGRRPVLPTPAAHRGLTTGQLSRAA